MITIVINIFIKEKPMKTLVLVLLFLPFMFGCTNQTTVHLYGRYLSPPITTNIKNTLERAGFNVEVNQLTFPSSIQQSAILYSPLIEDRDAISAIIEQLSLLNYPIHKNQPLVAGKHFYTKNNLGLFILPENENLTKQSIDIANAYKSVNCGHTVSLNLNKDGTYTLFFAQLPFSDTTDYLKGVWHFTEYPYLSLGPKNGYEWFYFKMQQEHTVDKIGKIHKTLLISQDKYSHLHFCDFAYGLRY
jgi:hypothetical protein